MAKYGGTEVQSSKSVKENIKLGPVQRHIGTQLKFPCYFTYVLEFLYRGTQVPNPKYAKDETFFSFLNESSISPYIS